MSEQPNPQRSSFPRDWPRVATETFRHKGRTVSVSMVQPFTEELATMLDPEPPTPPGVERLRFFNMGRLAYTLTVPPGSDSEPCVVFGVWCPAGFVVEGLAYEMEFSIRPASGSDRTRDIVISGLTIRGGYEVPEGVTRTNLAHIPTAKLLAAALNAASMTFIHYPANYSGPRLTLGDDGAIIEAGPGYGPIETTESGAFPVTRGTGVPMPPDFTQTVAGVPRLNGESRLVEIARIVRNTPPGFSTEKLVATRFGITERHARRLIDQAREAGHEPTNERTRKGKK